MRFIHELMLLRIVSGRRLAPDLATDGRDDTVSDQSGRFFNQGQVVQ